jgi:flagellar assembly factor FliW
MSMPAVRDAGGPMVVASRLFGPLTVAADACWEFPDGLLGFGNLRRFLLLPAAPAGVFWLQSVEEGALAFLAVDPALATPALAGRAAAAAGPAAPPDAEVLALVTLPGTAGEPATMNLRGPLVLDVEGRRGRQVVLDDPQLDTRHPIDLDTLVGRAA